MRGWLTDWWTKHRSELEAARRENQEAREEVATTMAAARRSGVSVSLSRAALERIATSERND